MSHDCYDFDRPLGIYGFESRQRLAEAIIRDFGRYEQTSAAILATAPFHELDEDNNPLDDFRLSSLVVEDDPTAHALAVTPVDDPNKRGLAGIYYQINLGIEPVVYQQENIFVTHSSRLPSKRSREADAQELVSRFDKGELEAVMRMVGKLATGLSALEQISGRIPEDTLPHHATIRKAVHLEPRVRQALQEHNLDNLKALYPGGETTSEPGSAESPKETIHIMEWQEFLDEAGGLFRRELDTKLPRSSIAIRHEIGNKTYYIKLAAEHGELRGAQILCDDTGAWKTQVFEIYPENEDAEDANLVSPIWDKDDILVSLRGGELIQDKIYEGYRSMAAKSLTATLGTSPTLIPLNHSRDTRKRPAA